MKKIKAFFFLFCMCLFISPVSAKEISHFYTETNDSILLEKTINASSAVFGEKVEVKSIISGALLGVGTDVSLSGETDYTALVGNSVNVSGRVLKDSVLIGNIVETKNATFERDVLILSTDAKLNGTFNHDVMIVGQVVDLKGAKIKGNVTVYGTNITVDKNTKIQGTLAYPKDAKIKISDAAKIAKKKEIKNLVEKPTILTVVTEKIMSILSLILIFMVTSLVVPKLFTNIDAKYETINFEKIIETFTKGLVIIVAVPIIVLLLMILTIGIPLAFILLALYAIAIYISKVFIAYLIGSKIAGKFKETSILVKGVIGLVILFIISLIPYVSSFLAPIILFVGLGVLFDSIKR